MVSLLIFTVGIPAILYLLLWISPVRQTIRRIAEKELSELSGCHVSIGAVEIEPFTRLNIKDVSIADSLGRNIFSVQRIGGGISPIQLALTGRMVISDVEIIGPEVNLWRDSLNAPLNVDPILAAFRSDKDDQKDNAIELALHTAVIRRGTVSYHVFSEPRPEPSVFSPHHINFRELRADVAIPRISNREINIKLKRLSMAEASGLTLRDMRASFQMTDSALRVRDFSIEFPISRLLLDDITVTYPSRDSLQSVIDNQPHSLTISEGSRIYPPDFAALLPALGSIDVPISLDARLSGTPSHIRLHKLNLSAPNNSLALLTRGSVINALCPDSAAAEINPLSLSVTSSRLAEVIGAFTKLPPMPQRIIGSLGRISLSGQAEASASDGTTRLSAELTTDAGSIDIDTRVHLSELRRGIEGAITAHDINLGTILDSPDWGNTDFHLNFNATQSKRGHRSGSAALQVTELRFKGNNYSDIAAAAALDGDNISGSLKVSDELIEAYVTADYTMSHGNGPDLKLTAATEHLDLCGMHLTDKYPGYILSTEADAELNSISPCNTNGHIRIGGISFIEPESGSGLELGPIIAETSEDFDGTPRISLSSDFMTAEMTGHYDFRDIKQTLLGNMLADTTVENRNDFTIKARILPFNSLLSFFNIHPKEAVDINGRIRSGETSLYVNAPSIIVGKNVLKSSAVNVQLGPVSSVVAQTEMETKNGDATINAGLHLNKVTAATANLEWNINRDKAFYGQVKLDASLHLTPDRKTIDGATIDINRSEMVFNDSTWAIDPARITVAPKHIAIDRLHIGRANQEISISGVASPDSADAVDVALKNIDLDYIFETLRLGDAIYFGGSATGDVRGSALLSGTPMLHTDNLHVDQFSYNGGVFGDADITARWDNAEKAIVIHADVAQYNGHATIVDGLIAPNSPGKLDFRFYADHTPVGFMKRLLAAFASDVTGEASGMLRLYGTLKDVQLAGRIKPHDFGLTIAAINCQYFTNDSVILTPGHITLNNIKITDCNGHTALLNGQLTHTYLKDCAFDFSITDAHRLLVYNVGRNDQQNWYGHILGNGNAQIYGEPGKVSVNANITTAPGSEFTFMLSDREDAGEYSFLTFRDHRSVVRRDSLLNKILPEPPAITQISMPTAAPTAPPTEFNMNLTVNATPDAKVTLVMDQAGGDKITAYGSGSPNILYNSSNDDFRIYGDYTLERGDYNFTLQNIIIKNFTIENGSRITFAGDLDHISLGINAIYALKANLSDLDESFLNDKEVGRTSVTVQALLQVVGQLSSPAIKFDLRFPTLTSDVDRKVHAIVSTEEMMNRQIIYLLALNRFYTPDYMTSTSGKGNELVSVASSTISSQLSNILGQLSDKFSVAPNLRSDAGDFSDVEFDVALSSTLLNNRLLLNGNFGYRDQILNDNQFIGDFDIEYLLNRGGNWRLKAYNHFNDRNLYVKTAMTTQGLGLVFKHDFDNLLKILRRKKRIENQAK